MLEVEWAGEISETASKEVLVEAEAGTEVEWEACEVDEVVVEDTEVDTSTMTVATENT